jgi:hypothetical protein
VSSWSSRLGRGERAAPPQVTATGVALVIASVRSVLRAAAPSLGSNSGLGSNSKARRRRPRHGRTRQVRFSSTRSASPGPPARQGHAGASLYSRPDPKTEPEDEHGTATPGPIIVATTLSCWAEAYLGSQHAQDTEQRAPVDGMRERTTRLPDRLEPGERRATEDQIVLIRCPGRRGVKAGAITSEATPSAVSCRYRSHPDTPEAQPEPTRSPATTARPSDQYARRRERDRPACQIGGGPYCVRIAAPIAPRVAPP